MSRKSISKKSGTKTSIKSDLARVDAMKDSDIDLSDIPATTEQFWKNAKVLHGHRSDPSSAASSQQPHPLSDVESRVWTILEQANVATKSIIDREREGELVGEDVLHSRLRTCR